MNDTTLRMSMVTLGCRVNQTETDWIRRCAAERGFVLCAEDETAALVVINTCSVTRESDRQARQAIRRAIRGHPGARVVVTGCYAQRDPLALAEIPGVDLILGNGEKHRFLELLELASLFDREEGGEAGGFDGEAVEPNDRVGRVMVGPVTGTAPLPPMALGLDADFEDRSRGYLHVQNGCDQHCTFCLIPQVRGGSRSAPFSQVLLQAEGLIRAGFLELVLTGINLGSYGRDLTPATSLARLVDGLAGLPGLGRLRLSSLDPDDLDDALLACFAEHDVLCSHVHLSVQSGDDQILKRMHRRHDRARILNRLVALRQVRPSVVVGADLIVGFPTETEDAFSATLSLVVEAGLGLLHVFRYSDRPGTAAARIPDRFRVGDPWVRQRADRLRLAGQAVLHGILEGQVGRHVVILMESVGSGDGVGFGKSDTFLPVRVMGDASLRVGALYRVRVTGVDFGHACLTGVILGLL